MAQLISYQGVTPTIESGCFIAPGAYLIGRVRLLEGSSVWYHAVLRGDVNDIVIGRFSNIQDNATVHVDSGRSGLAPHGLPTIVGDYVTVGHNCVLHACTVEDGCLIGMGAIVLDGAVIGRGSIVGAGAVVTKGTIIPP
ncbi:MAG: gamma carbonic anhydrase family protein, partial [Oscillospiraceae bacterium]